MVTLKTKKTKPEGKLTNSKHTKEIKGTAIKAMPRNSKQCEAKQSNAKQCNAKQSKSEQHTQTSLISLHVLTFARKISLPKYPS